MSNKDLFIRSYKGKKVFVTGHTGFKGSWLITILNCLGAKILGYALEPENPQSLYRYISSDINQGSIIDDIRNRDRLINAVLNFEPDYIFHLAAQPLVRLSYSIPSETFDVNVTGTANILEAAKMLKNKCSIIVITTDKVYENKETTYAYREDDTLGGYDPYSASKAAAEIVVSSFRNSFFNINNYGAHQKAVISARAGNVIGGGDWSKDRIIPDIIRSMQTSQPIEVRNPNSVRPWQHVLEPLTGYLLAGALLNENPGLISGAYNFGPEISDHLTVEDLVNIALKCWGSGTWVYTGNESQPHEAGLLKLNIDKAKSILHWQPKLNSTQAIEWTIDWYKQKPDDILIYTINQIEHYLAL
ncbi:CDP-glucose 4,6-dehydratase [Mucilaginibacter jinjuensis]|uniref:CDP-glucose 4,6-dehydratase n=1 Tax=Mucilaginibacter jinjuensis TaxID=1176721 RepID=A0ABY7T2U0_9SPHI|nr:CDP-glucose 4,6-dehydratase [Mucilaginibacter jinjuensis]WCT10614.1 CDP-glucose 4,6-dehydratase [Mucilaginibacter jinjuensis]